VAPYGRGRPRAGTWYDRTRAGTPSGLAAASDALAQLDLSAILPDPLPVHSAATSRGSPAPDRPREGRGREGSPSCLQLPRSPLRRSSSCNSTRFAPPCHRWLWGPPRPLGLTLVRGRWRRAARGPVGCSSLPLRLWGRPALVRAGALPTPMSPPRCAASSSISRPVRLPLPPLWSTLPSAAALPPSLPLLQQQAAPEPLPPAAAAVGGGGIGGAAALYDLGAAAEDSQRVRLTPAPSSSNHSSSSSSPCAACRRPRPVLGLARGSPSSLLLSRFLRGVLASAGGSEAPSHRQQHQSSSVDLNSTRAALSALGGTSLTRALPCPRCGRCSSSGAADADPPTARWS